MAAVMRRWGVVGLLAALTMLTLASLPPADGAPSAPSAPSDLAGRLPRPAAGIGVVPSQASGAQGLGPADDWIGFETRRLLHGTVAIVPAAGLVVLTVFVLAALVAQPLALVPAFGRRPARGRAPPGRW